MRKHGSLSASIALTRVQPIGLHLKKVYGTTASNCWPLKGLVYA